jgi:opacity protein-like surface antigen
LLDFPVGYAQLFEIKGVVMFVTKSTKIVKVSLILMLFSVFGTSTVSAADGLFAKIKKDGKWYAGLELNQTMNKVGEGSQSLCLTTFPHCDLQARYNTVSESNDMGFGLQAGIELPHNALFAKAGQTHQLNFQSPGFFNRVTYSVGVGYTLYGDKKIKTAIYTGVEANPDSEGTQKVTASALFFDLSPHYYFTKELSSFVDIGLGFAQVSAKQNTMTFQSGGSIPQVASASKNGLAYKLGLGVDYRFARIPVEIGASYSRAMLAGRLSSSVDDVSSTPVQPYTTGSVSTKPIDYDLLALHVNYYFNF